MEEHGKLELGLITGKTLEFYTYQQNDEIKQIINDIKHLKWVNIKGCDMIIRTDSIISIEYIKMEEN